MMPTETLRAMLDERGVDWDYGITGATTTRFSVNGIDLTFTPMRDGLVCSTILTPEKVIAATLGREDVYTREDVEGAFVSGYSLGSLPVGSDPRWDENRQTVDEHMAELGWVRKEAATLCDSDATAERRCDAGKVYLVEACDELIEGWCPLGVYLSREAAGRHAESLRGEVDGVMSFARVVEMEVLG